MLQTSIVPYCNPAHVFSNNIKKWKDIFESSFASKEKENSTSMLSRENDSN